MHKEDTIRRSLGTGGPVRRRGARGRKGGVPPPAHPPTPHLREALRWAGLKGGPAALTPFKNELTI